VLSGAGLVYRAAHVAEGMRVMGPRDLADALARGRAAVDLMRNLASAATGAELDDHIDLLVRPFTDAAVIVADVFEAIADDLSAGLRP
jgi:hypothetical protein